MQIQIYPVSMEPVQEMLLADSFVVQNCVPQPLISVLAKAIDRTNVIVLQTPAKVLSNQTVSNSQERPCPCELVS